MSVYDLKAPCATCPYRRETRLALWDKYEFDNLKEQDAQPLGRAFGCHSYKPPEDQRPCVGWLLDQKRRGTPSIALRIELGKSDEAAEHYKQLSEDGLDLYQSIEEMAEANYPGGKKRPSQPIKRPARKKAKKR